MDQVDCTRIPPYRRNVGMVFQNYTLFPHLSVLDNVAFPLKMRGLGKAERHAQAEAALKSVHLGGYGARMPNQLSGGQQQRVALARAIVYKPRILLMDEPFSALDKKLRQEMRLESKRLHAELGLTVVFVTHDQEEALTMADRVAVLKDGSLQQIGSPRELYERPANLFVAGFIGDMNFIPATFSGQGMRLPGGEEWTLPVSARVAELAPGPATVAIRPERLSFAGNPGDVRLDCKLLDVIYSGADTILMASLQDGTQIQARTSSMDAHLHRAGNKVSLYCKTEAPLVYGAGGV
jgi:putative spermidine/putrescine transport system ATP-binding protein/mannopine transport system ATP-binding protein